MSFRHMFVESKKLKNELKKPNEKNVELIYKKAKNASDLIKKELSEYRKHENISRRKFITFSEEGMQELKNPHEWILSYSSGIGGDTSWYISLDSSTNDDKYDGNLLARLHIYSNSDDFYMSPASDISNGSKLSKFLELCKKDLSENGWH